MIPTRQLPQLSRLEEEQLVERARQGDKPARDEIVLALMNIVRGYAYHRTYAMDEWAKPRINAEDLFQIGMLAVVENLNAALRQANPFAYLTVVAHRAIGKHCAHWASLVRLPGSEGIGRHPYIIVGSLDRPLDEEPEKTLADVLADVLSDIDAASPERNYTEFYDAINALPEPQRSVIVRNYGLFGHEPQSLSEISAELGIWANNWKRSAIKYLRGQRKRRRMEGSAKFGAMLQEELA